MIRCAFGLGEVGLLEVVSHVLAATIWPHIAPRALSVDYSGIVAVCPPCPVKMTKRVPGETHFPLF